MLSFWTLSMSMDVAIGRVAGELLRDGILRSPILQRSDVFFDDSLNVFLSIFLLSSMVRFRV